MISIKVKNRMGEIEEYENFQITVLGEEENYCFAVKGERRITESFYTWEIIEIYDNVKNAIKERNKLLNELGNKLPFE